VQVCLFDLFPAVRTQPFENQPMPKDQIAGFLDCALIHCSVVWNRHIANRVTPGTDQVIVPIRANLVTVGDRKLHMENFPRLLEHIQITVDGAAADFIVDGTNVRINLICARMIATRPDRIQDQSSLSGTALFQDSLTPFVYSIIPESVA
jgi:hypothetical protein